jgi:murein L,D-transpeptidase YafK
MPHLESLIVFTIGLVTCACTSRQTPGSGDNLADLRLLGPKERVLQAKRRKAKYLKATAEHAGLPYPVPAMYFRAFKKEAVLEAWGAAHSDGPFRLIKIYAIAAMSGGLGPKRKEGDRQVPEGLYQINRFNPASRFLLSLGLDYPNASDRILSDQVRPGGDIFIHGDRVSIGCLAMTDDKIMEIYTLADGARAKGQATIRVDVFPSRKPSSSPLAESLAPFAVEFDRTKSVPSFKVLRNGAYKLVKS